MKSFCFKVLHHCKNIMRQPSAMAYKPHRGTNTKIALQREIIQCTRTHCVYIVGRKKAVKVKELCAQPILQKSKERQARRKNTSWNKDQKSEIHHKIIHIDLYTLAHIIHSRLCVSLWPLGKCSS